MLDKDEVDFSVMAIENSIAGSLLNNYGLIRGTTHMRIIGEILYPYPNEPDGIARGEKR